MIGSNLLSIATGFAPMPIVPTGWKMRIFPGKDAAETLIPVLINALNCQDVEVIF